MTYFSKAAAMVLGAGILAAGAGCELVASVDRNLINGTGGGATTTTGTGGAPSPECGMPEDCPDPGNECVTRTCTNGTCGTAPVAAGTAAKMQTAGDCKVRQCDGSGTLVDADDDTDLPSDGNACTDDVCKSGVPSNPLTAAGTACGTSSICDGNGSCVGCVDASDCPGTDDECQKRTCTAGVCGKDFTAAGTLLSAQVVGDCKKDVCDGSGAVIHGVDSSDLPLDGDDCTDDVCTGDVPSNPPTMAGIACATNGGTTCDGAGACVECLVASTCPGSDDDCQKRTCTGGKCGLSFTAAGTVTTAQATGDCKQVQCDGSGGTMTVNLDTDLPDDSNPCTNDVCTGGVASNPFVAASTKCGAGLVCDATGHCIGCLTGADCPGSDTECQTRTCTAGTCGFSFAAAGTLVAGQAPGDCKKNVCNGAGAIVSSNDDADVPIDGKACTNDVCSGGVASNPPKSSGTACSEAGGTVCNGAGTCVQCLTAATCPGTDTDCKTRSCTGGVCGFANTATGTVVSSQTPGDCKETQCDGNGGTMSVAKNTDLPIDGNQCTSDVCTAGVASNPPTSSGTTCNQMSGTVCDGAGACVECVTGAGCPSGVCTNHVCQAASCTDSVKNGTETDVDCGGSCPSKCALGGSCAVDADCTTNTCTGGLCSQINGCDLGSALDQTGMAQVSIAFGTSGLTFTPPCIKVSVGTKVTFNGDFVSHPLQGGTVVAGVETPSATGPFATATTSGTTATFTMSSAGTFPYYCIPHGPLGMDGVVFVQ